MKQRSLALILGLAMAFSFSARAGAVGVDPVLLTIDLSDPSNAVITATGLDPENSDYSTQEGAGVDLEDFLTTCASYDSSTGNSSSLYGASNEDLYDSYAIDNASSPGYKDLNLYVSGGSTQNQYFDTSVPAFSGSITVNLSSYVGKLPAIGTTGYIIAGFSRTEGYTLGLWEVVPEPSEYGMYAFLIFAALIVWRRMSVSRQLVRA
jgi:hypothetical protein